MTTPRDRSVLNTILNPLMPNEPFDENDNSEYVDPFSNLPNYNECKTIEKDGIKEAEQNNISKAIELFTKAVDTCPNNPSPYNNRAQAYRLDNNIEGELY